MTSDHINRSEWFPRFLFPYSRYMEMSSLCSFLLHILCKLNHVFLEIHGFTSWRTKMKYSVSSRNSKPWSRSILKRRLILFDEIMAKNSLWMNSKSYVKNQGLRGIFPLLIIHNRMGLWNGRTELSWKLKRNDLWSRPSYAYLGRSCQNSGICIEPYST